MKKNTIKRSNSKVIIAIAVTFLLIAIAISLCTIYDKLYALWIEQCVITNVEEQITINTGKMVNADVITEFFELRKGANLATIDFAAKRKQILEKIPNIKRIAVTLRLPRKVTISVEERTPVARVNLVGVKRESGRVVDTEGVVFLCQRGTDILPIIREGAPMTTPGKHFSKRHLAALRLAEKFQEPELQNIGLLEVNITKMDFLIATLGNYSTAKIAWDGMDDDTPASHIALSNILENLAAAIRSNIANETRVWNATDPSGKIYADTKGSLK